MLYNSSDFQRRMIHDGVDSVDKSCQSSVCAIIYIKWHLQKQLQDYAKI